MIKKTLSFFFLILMSLPSFSQENSVEIYGKVIDSLGIVKNANIFNIATNEGTFTSDNGDFLINAKVGDSIRISSIQHSTRTLKVAKYNVQNKKMIIPLTININVLDEVKLSTTDLTGILGSDIKKVPTDKRDSILKQNMDFSQINMKGKLKIDLIDAKVKPPLNDVDPVSRFAGAGAKAVMPFKASEKLWALRRKLEFKRNFPALLMNDLGEDFFFKKLRIPIENYYHFLEYCNPLGIENLYKDDKLIEVIKILTNESTGYLEIIKKE